jgi:hypothetical protein
MNEAFPTVKKAWGLTSSMSFQKSFLSIYQEQNAFKSTEYMHSYLSEDFSVRSVDGTHKPMENLENMLVKEILIGDNRLVFKEVNVAISFLKSFSLHFVTKRS